MKRDALDALFSVLVREAANCCEAGGEPMLYENVQCSQSLECCHIHSRRHQYLRHDPLNCISMCSAHHRWYTDHPTEFSEFIDRKWPGRSDLLREKLKVKHKWLKGMKAEARRHYRVEMQRVFDERAAGNDSKIEIVGWL